MICTRKSPGSSPSTSTHTHVAVLKSTLHQAAQLCIQRHNQCARACVCVDDDGFCPGASFCVERRKCLRTVKAAMITLVAHSSPPQNNNFKMFPCSASHSSIAGLRVDEGEDEDERHRACRPRSAPERPHARAGSVSAHTLKLRSKTRRPRAKTAVDPMYALKCVALICTPV
jgi:hypothetical protein